MPCTKCFMRTRVVSKTTQFKQTALKWSWWIMHVIGSLFASVKADASAICFQHRHSRRWFNVAAVQCKHLHQSRVTNRPKTSSSRWASGRFESQKQTLHIRIMKLNNFINSKPQGLLKWGTKFWHHVFQPRFPLSTKDSALEMNEKETLFHASTYFLFLDTKQTLIF